MGGNPPTRKVKFVCRFQLTVAAASVETVMVAVVVFWLLMVTVK